MTEAVRFEAFSYFFDRSQVLRDISLSIEAGSFVAIVGRNGSGKSTLLQCMMGLLCSGRSAGSAHLFGKPVSRLSRIDIAKSSAYVPQSISGSHPFSVIEYVRLSRYPYESRFGWTGGADDAPVISALSTLGMMDAAHRPMNTLSGGECQKVVLAAALAQDTPLLLLDEPSAFLDHRHAGEIGRILRRIHQEEGRTVVTVTHDINRASRLCDRIIALKKGARIFDGKPADFMKEDVLHDVFEERFVLAAHPLCGFPMAAPAEAL